MSSRNKLEAGVYVPPGRRSESGSSNGGTPKKNNEEGPSREPPPNCCDDTEEGELEDSPTKFAINSASSSSPNWRCPNTSSDISRDFQRNLRIDKQKYQDVRIPVKQRTIKGDTRENGSISENSSRSGVRKEDSRISNADYNERLLETFHQSTVPYIDSHCHTDFMYDMIVKKNPTSHQGIIQWMDHYPEAFPKSFSGMIANFIKPDLFVHVRNSEDCDMEWIVRELQSNVYLGTTWGCHPHHVKKWGRMGSFWITLENVLSKKSEFKVVAVGECGIDQHRCESTLEDQRHVFEKHVELAFKHNLPLVIHCRNGSKGYSEDECLNILKKQMDKNHQYLKIHRHCYTENWNIAQKWLRQCPDVHFGFTGAIMNFNEQQIEAVRRLPMDRILLETDGPYFKPKCFDSKSPAKICLPGMAIATAARIAEIKNLTLDEVLRSTYNNTRRVYQIPVYDNC